MFYEIRVKKYLDVGSVSLEKYFKDKAKADDYVERLNKLLPNNMYFAKEIKLEDV